MSLPIQDQANILNGIRGGWTMRSEIINALMLNQRMTMEKWICYEEEIFFIPRVRETSDKVEGSKQRDNETPTLNNAIRVLAYTSHKCLVDPDSTKVQTKMAHMYS